jgi:SAM-dependent methyltransferase
MRARFVEICQQRPDARILSYILGPQRVYEWVHSVAVCQDAQLGSFVPRFPPLELRRITAAPDLPDFLWTGLADMERFMALYYNAASIAPGKHRSSILDFGCGCGRMVRFLSAYAADCSIHACDLNPEHVRWCHANLPAIQVAQSAVLPPLPYADKSFELVYSLSVFTHLSQRRVDNWISEMHRILAPGGVLIATTHGLAALETIKESAVHQKMFCLDRPAISGIIENFKAKAFFFYPYDQATLDMAKVGEEYGNAFIHPDYIYEHWGSDGFEVLDFLPGGLRGWQDITILRRKS